jgi:hypothetical protein
MFFFSGAVLEDSNRGVVVCFEYLSRVARWVMFAYRLPMFRWSSSLIHSVADRTLAGNSDGDLNVRRHRPNDSLSLASDCVSDGGGIAFFSP